MSSLIPRPARLYGALAFAEMITWTLLLLGMAGKYLLGLGDWGVRIGGGLHGLVFLSYCVTTVVIAVDQRWSLRHLFLGLGSAVPPYATVPFERHAERHGLLGDDWRLHAQTPGGSHERVVSAALRQPILAALVGLLLIGLTFAGLLRLGPPTQWFG